MKLFNAIKTHDSIFSVGIFLKDFSFAALPLGNTIFLIFFSERKAFTISGCISLYQKSSVAPYQWKLGSFRSLWVIFITNLRATVGYFLLMKIFISNNWSLDLFITLVHVAYSLVVWILLLSVLDRRIPVGCCGVPRSC